MSASPTATATATTLTTTLTLTTTHPHHDLHHYHPFQFEGYMPQCWGYECFDLMRRVSLTALLQLFDDYETKLLVAVYLGKL